MLREIELDGFKWELKGKIVGVLTETEDEYKMSFHPKLNLFSHEGLDDDCLVEEDEEEKSSESPPKETYILEIDKETFDKITSLKDSIKEDVDGE